MNRISTVCLGVRDMTSSNPTCFDAEKFLRSVICQNTEELTRFFTPNAVIYWRNTNEEFTAEEYIIANCNYPGDWNGVLERVESMDSGVIVVAKVWDGNSAFRAVSFITLADGKISCLDEYWGDVCDVPEWRRKMKIGKPIESERTVR
jgi:hypothetical protein